MTGQWLYRSSVEPQDQVFHFPRTRSDEGQLLALLFVCIATPEVHYGTGRHVYYLSAHQRVMAVKLNWVTQAFHIMSTCFGKISIVILMLRIIGNSKRQAWFLYSIISALFVISVVCVAFIFAQCTPASALWDPAVVGKCWSPVVQQSYGYFTACMCKIMLS